MKLFRNETVDLETTGIKKTKLNKKNIFAVGLGVAVLCIIARSYLNSSHKLIRHKPPSKFSASKNNPIAINDRGVIAAVPTESESSLPKTIAAVKVNIKDGNSINTAAADKDKTYNSPIYNSKHAKQLSAIKFKKGSYSSLIYSLKNQIEIARLKRELTLAKEGKNAKTLTDNSNMHPFPLILPPPNFLNSKLVKISKLKKSNVRLDGVSSDSAAVSVGKSTFVIQVGSEFKGYRVLNIGRGSITVIKGGKIKKLFIS